MMRKSTLKSTDIIVNGVFNGGDEGDRTPDLNAASVALSQLSYVPGRVGGVPKGIRTPVAGVKGRCPRPTRRWGPINKQIIMKES